MSVNDDTITRGTDNVFADLGFADPETHLLKAGLVTRIRTIMSDNGLTQTETGQRMGVSQPDLSRLLRGQFRDVSIERLMRMLTKLGCEATTCWTAAKAATTSPAAKATTPSQAAAAAISSSTAPAR